MFTHLDALRTCFGLVLYQLRPSIATTSSRQRVNVPTKQSRKGLLQNENKTHTSENFTLDSQKKNSITKEQNGKNSGYSQYPRWILGVYALEKPNLMSFLKIVSLGVIADNEMIGALGSLTSLRTDGVALRVLILDV